MDYLKENAEMMAFIKENPWPTMQEMNARFDRDIRGMEMYSEYGEFNHEALKKIYESNIDKKIAHDLGVEIAMRRGIQALSQNCMAFMRCSPLAFSSNMVIRANARLLEFAWDGISWNGQTFCA